MPKIKILSEEQPCRTCKGKLVRQYHKRPQVADGRAYYYEWWLRCTKCKKVYMVEAAKRFFPPGIDDLDEQCRTAIERNDMQDERRA